MDESVFRVVDPEPVCDRAQHAGDVAADLRSFGNLGESRDTVERLLSPGKAGGGPERDGV